VAQRLALHQDQPDPAHPEQLALQQSQLERQYQPPEERHRRAPEYRYLVAARPALALKVAQSVQEEQAAAQCSRLSGQVLDRSPPPVHEEHRLLLELSHRGIQGAG
jgi:hypothetical protein